MGEHGRVRGHAPTLVHPQRFTVGAGPCVRPAFDPATTDPLVLPFPDGGSTWSVVHCFVSLGRRENNGDQGGDG